MALNRTEVDAKIKEIIGDSLGVDEHEITPNASLVDDLGADELDLVELVMRYEEAFDITIPDDDDIENKVKTVRDSCEYVWSRINDDLK